MVTRRFLAIFYPAAEFLETTRITRVESEPFKTAGKVLVTPGWLAVYGKEAQGEDAPTLAPVKPNEQVKTTDIEVKQSQTKPPPRFTEATLLSAMEGAGKMVEDEELREAMREKGLGTPATRASTIEGLIYEQYVLRQGRELQATAKAFALMELLNGLGIPELTKPELTGDWEFQLRQVQRKLKSRGEFMTGIADMTRHIVDRAKKFEHDTIPGDFGVLKRPCPKCSGAVHERYREFKCVNDQCDFSIRKIMSGRLFEAAEIDQLIQDRQIGPLQGFRSKMGRPFAAVVKLNAENKIEFDFGQDQKDGNGAPQEIDFTGQQPVGTCPKCGGRVFETPMNYVCEKSVGANRSCDFRTGKIILQRPIERAQVEKLLATGKTDLLEKFISKKGRPFKAYLVAKDGKVGFEFEPRPAKGKKGGGKASAPKEPAAKIDFTGQESMGPCPKCGGKVFEGPDSWICEKCQAEKRPCKFKISKVILQQPIDKAQATKLLKDGRSDLLKDFVSSKTGNKFGAYLVMDENGKANFEFPPRESLEEEQSRTE
jgi:DNA topoisomerase-3